MRILILTQKVDAADDVLGFFHPWIHRFAQYCEGVTVICLEKGVHTLPNNVGIFSLGKERGTSRISYIFNFYKYIWNLKNRYDAVFVHMNPEYIILGGLLWRLWNKKIGLWYVHRQVNMKLRIAEKLAHVVFSTTPEAFRLKSKKVNFLGHGIDFAHFTRKKDEPLHTPLRILHVGRITPIKNLEILFEAAHALERKYNIHAMITCIGAPVYKTDVEYFKKLKTLVKEKNISESVFFKGAISYTDMLDYYKEADISVNLTPTGGMDKAVLESIACGTMALSANKAFSEVFGIHGKSLLYKERDANDLAQKINSLCIKGEEEVLNIQEYLYNQVKQNFDLKNLIKRITQLLHAV
ncbi:MAG: glycosyltransferase family 4 protein [Parcubacteria group bacterium]|nr:glycosyltransferase family 4 protein [Parcubacteria group bacterium]